MSKIDDYRHLNKDDNFKVDIEQIAFQTVHMNYGVHRLLSELVRVGKHRRVNFWNDEDNILKDIEELLNNGKH